MGVIFNIPIVKAKQSLPVDYDDLNDDMLRQAITEGLKVMLNAKMSKEASVAKLEKDGVAPDKIAEAKASIMAIAEKNLTAIKDGKYTKGRPSATSDADGNKIPVAVLAEARRLAKVAVKETLKANKIKISLVEPKEITATANELVQRDPQYLDQARINIAKRAEMPLPTDIASIIKVSPALVAKAEAAKAERKTQLSAKQAGLAAKRPVPTKGQQAPAPATVQ